MVKIPRLRPYLASISGVNGLECVTILSNTEMVTYAHKEHSLWQVGNTFKVWLHDESFIVGEVFKIDQKRDVIWLKTDMPLKLDRVFRHLPYEGQIFIQLGFSATEQLYSPFNVNLGKNKFSIISPNSKQFW